MRGVFTGFDTKFLFLSFGKYGKLYKEIMTVIGIAVFGVLAQLGERQVRNLKVRGSIPLYSISRPVEKSTGLFFVGA